MKKYLLLIATLLISNFYFSNSQIINNEEFELQELTGDKQHKRELKEQWENQINAIEDGINWKVLNQQSLYSKYLAKDKTKKHNSFLSETVGEGKIQGTWRELGSNNQAGRMHCVDIDFENDLLYAGIIKETLLS